MATPAQLGRYRILEPIGQGAMGAVYKALDPMLDRTVAVKTVGGVLALFPEHRAAFLERFSREARAAGRLSHPNIVSVHDMGVDEASHIAYIVMEYVPGVSLATVLRENPLLAVEQATEVLEQTASALDEAHRNGIVHRDIKPANIFLDQRGRVKVGDFGVARMGDSTLTQAGASLGTPGYVAPEVLQGAQADARSDVFSLGVLAYRLLTGRKPFEAATRADTAVQVVSHHPDPPDRVRPELSASLSAAVMRAIEKLPERRTPSAAAFLHDLQSVPPEPPRPAEALATPTPEPTRARPGALLPGLMAGSILFLGAAILGFVSWLRPPMPPPLQTPATSQRRVVPEVSPAASARAPEATPPAETAPPSRSQTAPATTTPAPSPTAPEPESALPAQASPLSSPERRQRPRGLKESTAC